MSTDPVTIIISAVFIHSSFTFRKLKKLHTTMTKVHNYTVNGTKYTDFQAELNTRFAVLGKFSDSLPDQRFVILTPILY